MPSGEARGSKKVTGSKKPSQSPAGVQLEDLYRQLDDAPAGRKGQKRRQKIRRQIELLESTASGSKEASSTESEEAHQKKSLIPQVIPLGYTPPADLHNCREDGCDECARACILLDECYDAYNAYKYGGQSEDMCLSLILRPTQTGSAYERMREGEIERWRAALDHNPEMHDQDLAVSLFVAVQQQKSGVIKVLPPPHLYALMLTQPVCHRNYCRLDRCTWRNNATGMNLPSF